MNVFGMNYKVIALGWIPYQEALHRNNIVIFILTKTMSTSCVLSAWQHGATETENPKEPLVSSFSPWHWLLEICHHLILYYSISNPPFIFITALKSLVTINHDPSSLSCVTSSPLTALSLFFLYHNIHHFWSPNGPLFSVSPCHNSCLNKRSHPFSPSAG